MDYLYKIDPAITIYCSKQILNHLCIKDSIIPLLCTLFKTSYLKNAFIALIYAFNAFMALLLTL